MKNKRITLADVAREAGCSVSMASYVLRTGGKGSSTPETRTRIMNAAKMLGYRTDFAARTLRTGKSRFVGVVLPRVDQGYIHRLVWELDAAFLQYNYNLFYAYFQTGAQAYANFCDAVGRMSAMNVEAIITPGFLNEIPDVSIPIVIWGNRREGYDCVLPDKNAFGHDVIERLYNNGHRRIFIAGIISDSRYTAMKDALSRLNILDTATFYNCTVSSGNAVEIMRCIAGMEERPTAVIFHSDEMALSGISEAHRLGIKIPEELSVIGYDNLPIGTSVVPMLSTYDQRFDIMAEELAKLTIKRLDNPDMARQIIAVKMNYIERKSFVTVRDMADEKTL